MTKDYGLVVTVDARIKWRTPAANPAERIMRDQADMLAQAAADKLREVVRLLVASQLEAQVDTASHFTTRDRRND